MNIRDGLDGLRVAKLNKDENATITDNSVAVVEYDAIKHLKSVQNINLTARKQTADVDADDVTETLAKCSGYDGTVQRTMFTPEEQAFLLGETVLENGAVVSSDNDEPPEVAVGFRCRVNGGKYYAVWVFRCKFSTGDFAAETAGTDKLNPQSDTLSFKSMSRNADGMWRTYGLFDNAEKADEFLSLETLQKIYKKTTSAEKKESSPEVTE